MSITVISVCRKFGIEPTPNLTWPVGAAIRERYESAFGCLPPKELRTKTSGAGSHCFAIYPDDWEDLILDELLKHRTESARQMSLF